MAVRSGDAPSHRRHKGSNSLSIPEYHSSIHHVGHPNNSKARRGFVKFFSKHWLFLSQHASAGKKHLTKIWIFCIIACLWLGMRHSKTPPLVTPFAVRPRVLWLEHDFVASNLASTKVQKWRSSVDLPYGEKPDLFSDDKKYDRYKVTYDNEETGCDFIADWQKQTTAKPTCNVLHEVGIHVGKPGLMNRLEFIDSGRLKQVWRVFDEDNKQTTYVLKTSVYGRKFTEREQFKHVQDVLVTAEASSSPFVLDMYAYCAYSSIAEAATETLTSWLRTYRRNLTGTELLKIAVMIANGIKDMQLYRNGMPTLAHADIKTPQFLLIENDGNMVFKVNDFNRGRFLTSKNPPEICPFYMSSDHKGSTNRAPEEYEKDAPQTEKIDIFSMGSIFYHLLTGMDPFKDIPFKTAMENIRTGVEVPLHTSIRNSTDPGIAAIVDAMDKCRRFRPEDRPSSKEIALELRLALEGITGSESRHIA